MSKLSCDNQIPVRLKDIPKNHRLLILESRSKKYYALPLGRHIIDKGIDTSTATATESDVRRGKTGYARGRRIIGTLVERIDPGGNQFYLTGCSLDWVNGLYTYSINAISVPSAGGAIAQLSGYTNAGGGFIHSSTSATNVDAGHLRIAQIDEPFTFFFEGVYPVCKNEGYFWDSINGTSGSVPKTTYIL